MINILVWSRLSLIYSKIDCLHFSIHPYIHLYISTINAYIYIYQQCINQKILHSLTLPLIPSIPPLPSTSSTLTDTSLVLFTYGINDCVLFSSNSSEDNPSFYSSSFTICYPNSFIFLINYYFYFSRIFDFYYYFIGVVCVFSSYSIWDENYLFFFDRSWSYLFFDYIDFFNN